MESLHWNIPVGHLHRTRLREWGAFPSAFLLLLGFGIWLLSHPYWGIWHDARVYTLMAVRWLNPEAFARDPWFMFGSQDSYSLFSPIYGSAIALFGINAAAKWGSFIGGGLFVASCWVFSRVLPLQRKRDLVFLILVSVPLVYCLNDTGFVGDLRVSESYITSRPFAISFGIAAVAAEIATYRLFALGLLVASAVLHPLLAVWPILGVLSMRLCIRARTLVAIAASGAALVTCLCAIEFGPFSPIDGDWGELVRATGRIVFVGTDAPQRLDFLFVCYSLLFVGALWGFDCLKRWYQVALILAMSAYFVLWVCSSFFPGALVMQLQLWRANWFALLWAVVAFVDLVSRCASATHSLRLGSLLLGFILVLVPAIGAPLVIGVAWYAKAGPTFVKWMSPTMGQGTVLLFRLVSFFISVSLGVFLLGEVQVAGAMLWRAGAPVDSYMDIGRGLLFTGGYGALAFGLWAAASKRVLWVPLMLGSVVAFVLGLLFWDDRTNQGLLLEETKWPEAREDFRPLFAGRIRSGQVVYWQGKPERVWFELRTASYASNRQAIGIVFSEPMTLEISRRLGRVALAGIPHHIPPTASQSRLSLVNLRNAEDKRSPPIKLHDLLNYEANHLTSDGLRFVCKDPELDFVIDDEVFSGLVEASFTETLGRVATTWNLYDCSKVRKEESA